MKNRIKTLALAVIIAISFLFAASPVVNAGVPRPLNSYIKKHPQHVVVRTFISNTMAIVQVYDGPGLVEVIIEGDD